VADVYTVGIWTVKAGREAEFVAAWQAMGEATLVEFPDAHGTLLHDQEKPGRFISFGPWESLDQIQAWRGSAAFREGVAAIGELLEGFEPGTYEIRAEVSLTKSSAAAPSNQADR
jgi:heme-degrading monooxygenase HmoA